MNTLDFAMRRTGKSSGTEVRGTADDAATSTRPACASTALRTLAWLLLVACAVGCSLPDAPDLPPADAEGPIRWLDQGLDAETRSFLHHASLGAPSLALPAAWLAALEQPSWWVSERPLLSDPEYLSRFGFLVDPDDPTGLPIGFARNAGENDDAADAQTVSLSCAACHTREIRHRGTRLRIDGAPATIAVERFERVLELAVRQTEWVPYRKSRALERMAGPDASDERIERFEAQFDRLAEALRARSEVRKAHRGQDEGYGRVDLSGRLFDEVLGRQLGERQNVVARKAPTRPAPLWGARWFEWAGYIGAEQPSLARAATKALGFGAQLSGNAPKGAAEGFDSTLQLRSLERVQSALAGPRAPHDAGAFTGLTAPSWPEATLGPIDRAAATRGEVLYDTLCKRCHLPPPNRDDFFDARYWTEAGANSQRQLKLTFVDTKTLGTDPQLAQRTAQLKATLPESLAPEAQEPVSAIDALHRIGSKAVSAWTKAHPREATLADQPRGAQTRAPAGYGARPLDGAWATAPYLHNGSVPTLYALLSPLAERPTRFAVSNRRFDPVKVGFSEPSRHHDVVLDTRAPGNGNGGHLFDDGEGDGILGRRLSPKERQDLIEFVKTIDSNRLPVGPSHDGTGP